MYCSECGAKGGGKFCWSCGHRLDRSVVVVDDAGEQRDELVGDWSEVADCQALLAYREVRERLARAAAESSAGMTGEQFLELCEKALVPLTTVKIPYAALAKFIQPLYAKMGVKTGKQRREFVPQPIGRAIVAVLGFLARNGQKVREARTVEGTTIIEAELPSDIFALAGSMTIVVRPELGGAWIEASTNIPGQTIDWGKSTRRLEALFSDARAAA